MNELKQLSQWSASLPMCRRCMLEEMENGADIAALLRRLIDAIPPAQKTDKDELNRRLDVCRRCDHLFSGTCALCGCFVELRASKKSASCPDSGDRWRSG